LRVFVELGVELSGSLIVSPTSDMLKEGTYSLDNVGVGGNSALEQLVKGLDVIGLSVSSDPHFLAGK
jgi:hypothetical protein